MDLTGKLAGQHININLIPSDKSSPFAPRQFQCFLDHVRESDKTVFAPAVGFGGAHGQNRASEPPFRSYKSFCFLKQQRWQKQDDFASVFCQIAFWRSDSGEGEIRTPATLAGRPVFETGAFSRSATSPVCVSARARDTIPTPPTRQSPPFIGRHAPAHPLTSAPPHSNRCCGGGHNAYAGCNK
jgi:hypothetical protein